MKKTILTILLGVFLLLGMVGCKDNKIDDESDNQNEEQVVNKFKKEYESYNGEMNKSGVKYRTVDIDSDNPFIYISAKEAIEKIDNNETFYLYIGDKQCPWCRSSIETAIKIAKQNNIEKIYYIYIWDDDHEEILRDKYVLVDGKPVLEQKGKDEYYELLKRFDSVLSDYTLKDESNKTIKVGEKRIFAPNYFYIKKGKVKKFTNGTSQYQKTSNETLTVQILEDQEKIFKDFFNN